MNNDLTDQVMTKEELLERAKTLATPIDFENLIADGILKKKGAGYVILDMNRLPEHAKSQIIGCSEGTVKFSKSTKSAQKLVDKLSK
ncbi:hypothetical protein [Pseudomonas sp. M30-35]|uniref:hypothetical protein n=1 Tax=Pseudomonas sp. M30-35 TaxID=1981174 RepID=UPI000B3CDE9D|nr:hypothetical protein [Pseudomonas sp. M30-35]ARU88289.1 hypothetical protein B9K09_10080 [Pseudomonas sp. M30-35]